MMLTISLAQRRKGAKHYRVSKDFLCAFAPLREKYFSFPDSISTDVESLLRTTGKFENRGVGPALGTRIRFRRSGLELYNALKGILAGEIKRESVITK